ncbi:MAG: FtsX-like permease family protein [Polaribacter sp.]|uniref:ABC transporter permease n=1 Tax=Polaribacter sp. TaxID=1920175 RepID=UPI0032655734
MSIGNITIKNIKSKPLYSILSIITLSLSIILLLGIKQIENSFKNQIENNVGNIDLIIGAKGSPLQLVLASVLHLDNPTGNISFKEAQKIGAHPMVKSTIPISYGDNYKGFRIVGTIKDYISLYEASIDKGKFVAHSMEVVLGFSVAHQLNLKIGDTFLSSHGLVENEIDVHSDKFTVVGILKPTKKVIDRLIITNLESIWDVHHHEEEEKENHTNHHHEEEEDQKEITSLLLSFKSPRALLNFPKRVNENTNLQAVLPKYELHKLDEYTSIGFTTISLIAYLILLISSLTIFISLYKMVKERAFDLAILRTYGANNLQLIKMLLYEGLLIALASFLVGFMLLKIGLTVLLNSKPANIKLNMLQDLPFIDIFQLALLIILMVITAVSIAIIPIIKMNISTILSNEK